MMSRTPSLASAAVVVALLIGGCAKAPRKALADAQAALTGAHDAMDCAPEEYAAARKMLDRALAASKAEQYDRARDYAEAAKALANKAAMKAQQNFERCRNTEVVEEDEPDDDDPSLMKPEFDDEWTLKTVYFDFNVADIPEVARQTLKRNAQWILEHPDNRVLIAGHADERGSTEFNLALGERRASSVKRFLTTMGVPPARLAVISYGEELPIDTSGSDTGYSRNRRAEFRVQ